jgi:hypothetical protein
LTASEPPIQTLWILARTSCDDAATMATVNPPPPSDAQLAMHRALRQTFNRIHVSVLQHNWGDAEEAFRQFCAAHADAIPQWYVDEYVFQAMLLWAEDAIDLTLRHFAAFINRAAGSPLIDGESVAEEVRAARRAPDEQQSQIKIERPAGRPPLAELAQTTKYDTERPAKPDPAALPHAPEGVVIETKRGRGTKAAAEADITIPQDVDAPVASAPEPPKQPKKKK